MNLLCSSQILVSASCILLNLFFCPFHLKFLYIFSFWVFKKCFSYMEHPKKLIESLLFPSKVHFPHNSFSLASALSQRPLRCFHKQSLLVLEIPTIIVILIERWPFPALLTPSPNLEILYKHRDDKIIITIVSYFVLFHLAKFQNMFIK